MPEAPPAPPAPRLVVADVPASRGVAWLAQGFALFKHKPFAWLGLAVGWLVITFGLLIVPFVGGVVANFLQPVFFASFALAAKRQSESGTIETGDLFLGFRTNLRALVNVGAILLFAEFGIFALMAAMGLPSATISAETGMIDLAAFAKALQGKEWIIFTGLVLTAVVKGALWFAPPLIAFHGLTTAHAIRWSVYAALSNFGAMIVYGIVLSLMFLAAMIPWGLGLLAAIPVMLASTYIGYRDVFEKKTAVSAG